MPILLLPAPRIYDFRGGVRNGNKRSMEEDARMSDTRARLARCEIYRLSDQGGGVSVSLSRFTVLKTDRKKLVIRLCKLGAKKGVRDTLSSTPWEPRAQGF